MLRQQKYIPKEKCKESKEKCIQGKGLEKLINKIKKVELKQKPTKKITF